MKCRETNTNTNKCAPAGPTVILGLYILGQQGECFVCSLLIYGRYRFKYKKKGAGYAKGTSILALDFPTITVNQFQCFKVYNLIAYPHCVNKVA